MKLRTKISLGFGVLLLLVIVVGVIAILQFGIASRGFTEYRALARDTNLASRLQINMLMVRMNVKDFIISGLEKDVQEYNSYLAEMTKDLEIASDEIQNPERAKLIKQVLDNVTEYQSGFEEVQKFQAMRNDHVDNYLNVLGPEMERSLTDILVSAEADGDTAAAFYSALVMRNLLLARLYIVKFLDDNEDSNVDRVNLEITKMDENLNLLDASLENAERRSLMQDVISAREIYLENFTLVVNAIRERNYLITNHLDVLGPEIAGWLDDVTLSVQVDQDELGPRLQASNNKAMIMIIIILAVAMAVGILIAVITVSSVLKQLGSDPAELMVLSETISKGDLTSREGQSSENSVGVFNSMLVMKEKLAEIVATVLAGSEQIASASEQLASGNQDLSNRTEQQASALEETSSAIEEMNASVKSNADNTTSADKLARDAATRAEEGSEAVREMVVAMNEINESSTRIADIIEVINNIAFQTNLLALNASIEAARAGEQGKGFAVVAVEVRKLAKRSDRAAREIADIIKESGRKVEEGVDVANSAGSMLEEINASIRKVTALVAEISAASQEQLSSVDQIDKTLASLDENTQKNAAMVEEAASATEELSGQAQELNTTMQFFRLDMVGRKKQKPQLTTGITLSDKKDKKEKNSKPQLPKPEKKATADEEFGPYDTFSELANEGEFDEF